MEPIIERIKDYVLVINPEIGDDDYLDFVVRDIVDRALVYMNRDVLVAQFEEDIADETVDEEDYVYPIPPRLERTLAGVVTGVYRTVQEGNSATTGAIKSISDNGQSITYGDSVTSYVSTASDHDIFVGATEQLNRYLLARVIGDDCTDEFYPSYWR